MSWVGLTRRWLRIFLSLSGRAKLVFASTLSVKTIRRGGARVVGQGRIVLG